MSRRHRLFERIVRRFEICNVPGDTGCKGDTDCGSHICRQGKCQLATCADVVQNGDESDVDCGGPACRKCDAGRKCASGTDCLSGVCKDGICSSRAAMTR